MGRPDMLFELDIDLAPYSTIEGSSGGVIGHALPVFSFVVIATAVACTRERAISSTAP